MLAILLVLTMSVGMVVQSFHKSAMAGAVEIVETRHATDCHEHASTMDVAHLLCEFSCAFMASAVLNPFMIATEAPCRLFFWPRHLEAMVSVPLSPDPYPPKPA